MWFYTLSTQVIRASGVKLVSLSPNASTYLTYLLHVYIFMNIQQENLQCPFKTWTSTQVRVCHFERQLGEHIFAPESGLSEWCHGSLNIFIYSPWFKQGAGVLDALRLSVVLCNVLSDMQKLLLTNLPLTGVMQSDKDNRFDDYHPTTYSKWLPVTVSQPRSQLWWYTMTTMTIKGIKKPFPYEVNSLVIECTDCKQSDTFSNIKTKCHRWLFYCHTITMWRLGIFFTICKTTFLSSQLCFCWKFRAKIYCFPYAHFSWLFIYDFLPHLRIITSPPLCM